MQYSSERCVIAGICVAVAVAVSACQPPSPGKACGEGWCRDEMSCEIASVAGASPREMCVVPGVCGNGVMEPELGEVCDDGNTDSGDGCASDCRSTESCGNHVIDDAAGETCDPPVLGQCDDHCHIVTTCGNGRVDAGEECDYGEGNNDNGDCRMDCVYNRCGDGHQDIIGNYEGCDDGMTDPNNKFNVIPRETDFCNIDCTRARCGDHKLNRHFIVEAVSAPEECDGGDDPPQDCLYGKAFCVVCDSNCQQAAGRLHVCGDGVVDAPNEVCDHGNKRCGSCSANCQAMVLAKAAGFIVAAEGIEYLPGDTFTIGDGIRSVTFQFTHDDSGSAVRISFHDSDNDAEMAQNIANAIATTDLLIDATVNGNRVMLMNRYETSLGNQPITSTVSTANFRISGMTGGAGADCVEAERCHDNTDCLPTLVCSDDVCAIPCPHGSECPSPLVCTNDVCTRS